VVDAPRPLPARVDEARLGQALGNLVENALKYSPPGTAITVRARQEGPGRFALEVADDGVGIPREVLPRVFERYYRVEGRASGGPGGMGLGLSIVAGIARAHGGSVEARPGAVRGTVFTIHLPAIAAPPAPPPDPERAAPAAEAEHLPVG
jgi:two-component system OmpR family sensor kinase